APTLRARGYALVRVRLSGSRRQTLQVMAERSDDAAMTVDDCTDISRALSAVLDVEDPVCGSYDLEISSPGIDRPLVKLEDFGRYVGFQAQVRTKIPLDGQRKFCGQLVGVTAINVSVDIGDGNCVIQIPFVEICDAKLVLTEDLVVAARKRDG
ncbi:MAG TPA: ribosome maturation factor RimP, partial [Alphaproteobacteria bacterium]|nr:ribosome maturation factor RimP [Alphaproteobacteria bacterium]